MTWLYVFSVLCIVLGLLVLSAAAVMYRRYRYVEDLPTSTVRAAAVGLTEVKGRVVAAEEPFPSPFQERPSVLCHYAFFGRLPAGGGWAPPRDTGTLGVPFYVEDETGRILVRPEGAEIRLPSHLTELSGDEERMEELAPPVAERYKERKRNGTLPDISGERATVANAVYRMNQNSEAPRTGPSCGAELRLEEGDDVYVIGSAQPLESDASAGSEPAHDEHTLFIGKAPNSEGAFSRLFNTLPYLSAAYGSIFEIYTGNEGNLMAENKRETRKGIGIGFLLFVLGLIPLLVLLLNEGS